jgi:vacuolar-type H+-ATPase subunit F/Vma7
MSRRVGVVGGPHVSLGFRLAGLRPRVAESREIARSLLDEMARDGRWGVILVQEDLMPDPQVLTGQGADSGLPILVPFPAPSRAAAPGEAEAYVAELLRRAVGYRVRLR